MDSVDVFSVRDLRQRSGDLIREAEHGLAALTAEEFIALLGNSGVPAVDYPPDELAEELSTAG